GAGAAHVSGDVVAGRLQVRLRRLHVAVGADLAGFVADVVANVLQVLADVAAVVPRTGRAEAEQDNEKGGRTWTHDETLAPGGGVLRNGRREGGFPEPGAGAGLPGRFARLNGVAHAPRLPRHPGLLGHQPRR